MLDRLRHRRLSLGKNAVDLAPLFVVYACLSSSAMVSADTLLGEAAGFQLVSIDENTAETTFIGNAGPIPATLNSLAYDANSGLIYGVASQKLYTINDGAGVATLVGDTGFSAEGLAFDPNTNTLYGVKRGSFSQLWTIDTSTGAGHAVTPGGAIAFDVWSLAFDPNSNALYGTHFPNRLISIDTTTGVGTLIGIIGSGLDIRGLAFDRVTNTLYGTDVLRNRLIAIDPVTGAGTIVGDLNFLGSVQGLTSIATALAMPGDFNDDGTVDSADYVVWRKNDGTQEGYEMWRAHFGVALGSGSGSAPASADPLPATIPEPATLLLLTFGLVCSSMGHRTALRKTTW